MCLMSQKRDNILQILKPMGIQEISINIFHDRVKLIFINILKNFHRY